MQITLRILRNVICGIRTPNKIKVYRDETTRNPFLLNTYHGKRYFCDREHDLKKLQNHIENDRNVVLYAWRRLGKSALIQRFFEELEDSGNYETLYVDFGNPYH